MTTRSSGSNWSKSPPSRWRGWKRWNERDPWTQRREGTAPHVDPHTGEIEECPECAELEAKRAGLERALATLNCKYEALGRELDKQRKTHPNRHLLVELFDYWVQRCGKNRSRTKLVEKREKAGLWALEEYDTDMDLLRRAIDGAAEGGYVDGKGVRHDEFELIFRVGERNVEKNVDRAEAHDRQVREREEAARRKIAKHRQLLPPWDRLFVWLRFHDLDWYPADLYGSQPIGTYVIDCPKCSLLAYAREDGDGMIAVDCRGRRCSAEDAASAFEWTWAEDVGAIRADALVKREMVEAAIQVNPGSLQPRGNG